MSALLLAAHGTRSAAGLATVHRLLEAVRIALPSVSVSVCFLDVLEPSLGSAVAGMTEQTVVVPALLSTGYHVTVDIPSVVGSAAVVARHLGPSARLSTALLGRLAEARVGDGPDSIALVGAGSSSPDARAELEASAALLQEAAGRPVQGMTVVDADLDERLARLARTGCEVATFLLAEGYFADSLRARARAAGIATVSDVIGAHPAVVELIVERYREALAQS